jgi:regulator of nucleoside diphosphate kinase
VRYDKIEDGSSSRPVCRIAELMCKFIGDQEMFVIHDDQIAHTSKPPIVLTSEDRERLSSLKDAAMEKAPEVARFLLEELERADIVPPGAIIASPLVRMGSEVKFIDHATDRIEQVRLVYPEEADDSRGWISVLTPTGSALLGLGPGQSIDWNFADVKTLRLSILDIRQPSDKTVSDAKCR